MTRTTKPTTAPLSTSSDQLRKIGSSDEAVARRYYEEAMRLAGATVTASTRTTSTKARSLRKRSALVKQWKTT